jgi:hypothetical protein
MCCCLVSKEEFMAEELVKCPHCFGEKPAVAKVCLHCGRDENGFGPMVRSSQTVMVPDHSVTKRRPAESDLKIHMLIAVIATVSGFLILVSSGLGSLLFIFGLAFLLTTRVRMWWRENRGRMFRM